MAGRKKIGDIGRHIGVKLDKPVERIIDLLAQESPQMRAEAGSVIRTIVTGWLMHTKDIERDFAALADEVQRARAAFGSGLVAGRAIAELEHRLGKRPRRSTDRVD